MYLEIIADSEGKPAYRILVRMPGLDKFSEIASGPCRCHPHKSSKVNAFWIVIGDTFYEVYYDGSFDTIGTLKTDTGFVYMDDNGTHVLVVDGSNTGYIYTIATRAWDSDLALTVTNSGDNTQEFIGGDHVRYVGGYFFVIQPGTPVIQACTAPYGTAPTIWFAADVYATVLEDAGPLIALGVLAGELWAFGNYSSTVFYNAQNPTDFPFSERPGAQLNIGISARASLFELAGSFRFLAKTKQTDRFVAMTQGYGWTRISNTELEQAIAKYAIVSDADAFGWLEEGHVFYQLTFTNGNQTWLYDDFNPQDWCERTSYGLGRHRSFGLIQFNEKKIVADRTKGTLYWQHAEKHTDNGDPIIWTRRFQRISKGGDPVTCNVLVIGCQTGTGLQAGPEGSSVQGEDPQMSMKYSWNGGTNWSNEMTASVGKIGEDIDKVRFPQLGSGYDWKFELSGSDPVPWALIGALGDFS